jgi:hypothetical protein
MGLWFLSELPTQIHQTFNEFFFCISFLFHLQVLLDSQPLKTRSSESSAREVACDHFAGPGMKISKSFLCVSKVIHRIFADRHDLALIDTVYVWGKHAGYCQPPLACRLFEVSEFWTAYVLIG